MDAVRLDGKYEEEEDDDIKLEMRIANLKTGNTFKNNATTNRKIEIEPVKIETVSDPDEIEDSED